MNNSKWHIFYAHGIIVIAKYVTLDVEVSWAENAPRHIRGAFLVLAMYIDELRRRAAEIRNSPEYKEWRMAVLERDNFHCTQCGRKRNTMNGIRLEVDHIQPFLLYPELMFEVNNGRTLCSPCHRKTPTYGNSAEHKAAHRATIHPFFKGDYLFKLKSVPTCMTFVEDHPAGVVLKFRATAKKWKAGYGRNADLPIQWNTEGDTPEEAIDNLILGLERLATK